MVLQNITYYIVLGKPLMFYLGIITIISLFTTATLGYLTYKGKNTFSYHRAFAVTTLSLALIHGILGFLAYF